MSSKEKLDCVVIKRDRDLLLQSLMIIFLCFIYLFVFTLHLYIVKLLQGITPLNLIGNAYARIQEELERCTGSLSSRGCSSVRQRFVQSVCMCFVDLEKNSISRHKASTLVASESHVIFSQMMWFCWRWPQARATAVHSSVKRSG